MKMKRTLVVSAGALLFLAMCLLSCGNKQGTSGTEATPASPSAQAVDAATAGSIMGSVKLNGTPPKMKVINMAAEPACAKDHASSPAMTQDVVPGDNGTLQNVVVYLQGDFSKYKFDEPTTPATIDQKGCMYEPHVLALRTGQTLDVVNADPVTHNIHPVPKDNREWNQSQPPGASPIMQSFAREEVAIPVKCNVHPWMKAYIAVFDNPYYAVTGKDGSFTIKNVPPGTYTVTAWQESLGSQDQMVTVGPSESKTVTLTYKANAPSGN